jgi:hypothetical protein
MPTIKELHEAIRQYNATSCVKGYSGKKKAELLQIVNRMGQKAVGATASKMAPQKKKIKPTLVSAAGSGSGMTFGAKNKKKKKIKPTLVSAAGGGSGFGAPSQGGTKAQKKYKKKLSKIEKKYMKLAGKDNNPELAF